MVQSPLTALQFGFERTAHSHIQFLKTTADAEQRNATVNHPADELQRDGVTMMIIGFMVLRGLFAIMRRVHVGYSPRHQYAVKMRQQAINVCGINDIGNHHCFHISHFRQ